MRDHDQQFFDTFILVIGGLMAICVVLFVFVRQIGNDTEDRYAMTDPRAQALIDKRIAPIGQVVMMGSAELKAAEEAAAKAQQQQAHAPLTGPQVFNAQCHLCHAPPGVGGAPVVGNAAAWDPRIAEGLPTLYKHALNGFQGKSGVMPPKGGRPDFSDDEIEAAVRYMVDQVKKK